MPGGAASGILPPSALDAPLTRDGLREYGAGPGSAAVQVFPTSYSPLRLLAETMRFFAEESCQKCTPCRIGNRALHHLCEELEHGEAAMTREKVDEWLLAMEKTSICGLGQASPFPVRNAMTHWPELFARSLAAGGALADRLGVRHRFRNARRSKSAETVGPASRDGVRRAAYLRTDGSRTA